MWKTFPILGLLLFVSKKISYSKIFVTSHTAQNFFDRLYNSSKCLKLQLQLIADYMMKFVEYFILIFSRNFPFQINERKHGKNENICLEASVFSFQFSFKFLIASILFCFWIYSETMAGVRLNVKVSLRWIHWLINCSLMFILNMPVNYFNRLKISLVVV